jgi:hypothetical protein
MITITTITAKTRSTRKETSFNYIVVKKIKKITKNNKPNKYLRVWKAEIQEKDYTLTQKEEEIIKREKLENPDLDIFCNCCCCDLISDIPIIICIIHF